MWSHCPVDWWNVTDIMIWRRLDLPGHEIGRLRRRDHGWELSGTAVLSYERRPCKLDYLAICDSGWRTESARIAGSNGDREIDLRVAIVT
jgi:uncharacterized protein